MNSYSLVFDFTYDNTLEYYIPKAYIVKNEEGLLGFVVKIANQQTLDSCEIIPNNISSELLILSERIQPKALFKKYNTKNRVAKPLEVLFNDSQLKKIIHQFIEVTLERFFGLISKAGIPLSIGFDKSKKFEKQQVFFTDISLYPKFYFHKTDTYLEYRLSLFDGKQELIPCEQEFQILLDKPPYVLHQNNIYTLKYINAHKLTPFLNKQVIKIPQRSSVEYFNKFIKKVITKSPIEAKGFDVVTYNTCKSCIIKPTTTIFSKVYFIELYFNYENHSFSKLDKTQKHINLKHNNKGEFTVFETIRNRKQEQSYIDVLKGLGIEFLENGLGTFNPEIDEIDVYYNISKLIDYQHDLRDKSIEIDFHLHNIKINESPSNITSNYEKKNDWFDVKITIQVGNLQFPFISLLSNLESGERLFLLPDGSHFIIPLEWYSRYKSLVQLGKVENTSILIQKNQFTLLEEAKIATQEEFSKDILPYQTTGQLKAKLRNYQKTGVNWLVKNYQLNLGSCLADDMGLGKTVQTLAYLDFVFTRFKNDFTSLEAQNLPLDLFSALEVKDRTLRALIVSPSSLTFNWYNETKKFCPHFSSLSYIGQNRTSKQTEITKADIVFTSYGTLLKDIQFLKNIPFNFLIIDESQQIKNRNSKIYKAINTIEAEHKVSLSGTPIENSLSDLWSQMQFINPNLLGNYSFFDKHFKKPIEKDKSEETIKELKLLINPYLLRRTKMEVAKDLPELSEQIFYTKLLNKQTKLYEEEKSRIRNYLIDKKLQPENRQEKGFKISILNALLKLRQLANHPLLINEEVDSGKFNDISAYLETLIQARQKTLVFSPFTSYLKIYTDWCDKQGIKYNLLTGKTKVKDREKEVDGFENNEDSLLFFISLKAGGTGLNLTKASYVLILDPWWNPFAELQAIGRAHRIGQTQKVNVVRFIAKHTIEEKINQLQQAKKDLSDSIIESQITNEIFNNIDYILD